MHHLIIFFIKDLFMYFMYMGVLPACMSCTLEEGIKLHENYIRLQLYMVVSHPMGA